MSNFPGRVEFNPADFPPNMGGYTNQGAFRFWCQKVLPLVFDDSLSYYELLNKVVDYLNKVIQDVTTMEDNIRELYGSYGDLQGFVNENLATLIATYNELHDYVEHYFDTLDVTEQINNKLNAMAEDGTLTELMVSTGLIPQAVDAWLAQWVNQHLDPTVPPLDNTLTLENAAAQSKAAGDFVRAIQGEVESISVTNLYPFYSVVKNTGFINEDGNEVTTGSGAQVSYFTEYAPCKSDTACTFGADCDVRPLQTAYNIRIFEYDENKTLIRKVVTLPAAPGDAIIRLTHGWVTSANAKYLRFSIGRTDLTSNVRWAYGTDSAVDTIARGMAERAEDYTRETIKRVEETNEYNVLSGANESPDQWINNNGNIASLDGALIISTSPLTANLIDSGDYVLEFDVDTSQLTGTTDSIVQVYANGEGIVNRCCHARLYPGSVTEHIKMEFYAPEASPNTGKCWMQASIRKSSAVTNLTITKHGEISANDTVARDALEAVKNNNLYTLENWVYGVFLDDSGTPSANDHLSLYYTSIPAEPNHDYCLKFKVNRYQCSTHVVRVFERHPDGNNSALGLCTNVRLTRNSAAQSNAPESVVLPFRTRRDSYEVVVSVGWAPSDFDFELVDRWDGEYSAIDLVAREHPQYPGFDLSGVHVLPSVGDITYDANVRFGANAFHNWVKTTLCDDASLNGYVTQHFMGTDGDATNPLNMYYYETHPPKLVYNGNRQDQVPEPDPDDWGGIEIEPVTVILTANLHAKERNGNFSSYNLIKNVANLTGPEDAMEIITWMHYHVHFVWMPYCCVNGTLNGYTNKNGVNLNRDFPNWKGGTCESSEANNIKNVMDTFGDTASLHIDLHTFARSGDYPWTMWIFTDDDKLGERGAITAQMVANKYAKKYPENASDFTKYVSGFTNIDGTCANYIQRVYGVPACTIECQDILDGTWAGVNQYVPGVAEQYDFLMHLITSMFRDF